MRLLLPLALLGACAGDGDPSAPEDSERGVMRDCPAEEGVICPWAGAGFNGFNGDGKDVLDSWFSYPMSVTFSPYGPPAIADWNNHKIRIVEDGTLHTIMGTDFLGDGDAQMLDQTEAGAPGTTVALNHPTMQRYFADGTLLSASWHTHKLRTWDPETGLVHVYLGSAPGIEELPQGNVDEYHDASLCKLNQPKAVEIDEAGDVYILDMRNEKIRKLLVDEWMVGTVAGTGEKGYCGEGDALTTCFNFPKNANPEPGGAMALDEDAGLMYVADTESHVIRVIDLENGTISLLAGTPGLAGDADGPGVDALFDFPSSLARDGDTLFVADSNNHKVKAIDLTTGEVRTFAGTGEPSCEITENIVIPEICDNQSDGGDGGLATEATLYRPFGVDLDLDGNLVIADSYNHRIRVVYR